MVPHDFAPVYRKRLMRRLRRRQLIEDLIVGFFLVGVAIGLLVVLGSMFY